MPPLIERVALASEAHIHAFGKPDPSGEASLRDGDQDRNIRVESQGNEVDEPLAFGFRTAKAVEDDEIGAIFDRGCEPDRETGEPIRIESASNRGRCVVRCEPDDFAVREHDDTELRIFRLTGTATLDDPDRPVTGTAEIVGEALDQRVRVLTSAVNQGRQVALGVEGQAASLSIYPCVYTALPGVGKPQARGQIVHGMHVRLRDLN